MRGGFYVTHYKKKQLAALFLCSTLIMTGMETPWAFSDDATFQSPDDAELSDFPAEINIPEENTLITSENIPDSSESISEISDGASFTTGNSKASDISGKISDITPDAFQSPESDSEQPVIASSSVRYPVSVSADAGFVDSVFRQWITENVDLNHDNLLTQEEIASCTEMHLSSLSIDSLQGIEYFYNLKDLDCSGLQLLSLNVSSNPVLEILNCSSNQLKQLNLTSCKKLKELNIASNSFTEADKVKLPQAPSLEKLNISGLPIQELKLSLYPQLKELDCSKSELTVLDFDSASLMEKLICSDSLVYSLNISRLSRLKYLDCSSTYLTQLEFSAGQPLEVLYCQDNFLTELNLSGLFSLKKLNCSGNKLIHTNFRDCPLEELSCNQNSIRTPQEFYDFSAESEPGDIIVEENGSLDSSMQLTAIDKQKPVKIRRRFPSAGIEQYGLQSIYIGYLNESDFQSSELFYQMQETCPLNEDAMISRETLKEVSELRLNSGAPVFSSDLAYFTGLKVLTCINNPALVKLDLRQNPQLVSLVCINTGLKSLDLTSNQALEYVQVTSNNLSSLNVTGLSALNFLDYRFNHLSQVDTTGCISLKEPAAFPQDSYKVKTDQTGQIPFSALGNFHESLSDSETIEPGKNLLYTPGDHFFTVKNFSTSPVKTSFSIVNSYSREVLGTCQLTITVVSGRQNSPSRPALQKIRSSHNVTLTWKKVKNISGYRILRKENKKSGASWKAIATVPASRTSYADNTGLIKQSYLYTVQSYVVQNGKKVYSKYDTRGLAGKATLKCPVITRPEKTLPIYFSWTNVPGADGYRIYRREKGKSKKWKLLGSTEFTDYTDMNAIPKVIYDYAVRPYRKTGKKISLGDYASTGYVCQSIIPKVTLTSVTAQDKGITVEWEWISDVDGYMVYRSSGKKGTYKKISTIKNSEESTTLKYHEPEDSAPPHAYYKIRAYIKTGQKYYYGSYSNARTFSKPSGNPNASDFAEFHMGYQLSRQSSVVGFDREYNEGGSFSMAAAYLTRGSGPVYEWQSPYEDFSAATDIDFSPDYKINEIVYIPTKKNALDNQEIKQAVMKYGAVGCTYFSSDEYLSEDGASYYLPADYNAGRAPVGSPSITTEPHAVAIVGWDDNYAKENFSVRPEGDGAFLCKNSWGEDSGLDGYFYISYYDGFLAKREFSIAFSQVSEENTYHRIYQYDPLGATVSFGYSDELYCANVFPENGAKLKETEKLGAVSFYTYDSNYHYEVFVIRSYKNTGSFRNLPAPSASGTFRHAGYHTVSFSRPLTLKAGTRFAVAVKLWSDTGATGYFEAPLEDYSSSATAFDGESYISHHGDVWTDFNTYLPDTNACIKAFTNGKVQPVAVPAGEPSEVYSAGALEEHGVHINPAYETDDSGMISPVMIGSTSTASATELPAAYDLRQYNRVSPVKDQGSLGLCWTFATYASLESHLLS